MAIIPVNLQSTSIISRTMKSKDTYFHILDLINAITDLRSELEKSKNQ